MYVWRIPIGWFAALTVSLLILVAARAILWLWSEKPRRRTLAIALLAVLAIGAPFAAHATIQHTMGTNRRFAQFIRESPLHLVTPLLVLGVMLALERLCFGRFGTLWRVSRERVLFYLAMFSVVVLNFVNWCAPGWCFTFGFPLPWYRWSDAIMTFNGRTPDPFSPVFLLIDCAAFVAVASAAGYWLRRRERIRLVFSEFDRS